MRKTGRLARISTVLLAVMFTFITVFGAASAPAYAAVKKPAKVTDIKVTARSNTSVYVKWKKAKNSKKYLVYRATSKKGKYKKIATTSRTYFLNSKLSKGKTYYYKVRAVNGSRKGSFSVIRYARTKNDSKYDVTVNKADKTVTIRAKLNGRFFTESTRHLMIDSYGFNKGLSILTSYCTPDDLYNGLVKAGGISWSRSEGKKLRNGEKNTVSNAENKKFSKLDVTLSWEDENGSIVARDLNECLTTVKGGAEAPEIDMIFSGNPKAAAKTPSGCMVCMDSCYIGMVANSAYGLCVIDDKEPALYAREEMLPEDGTVITVAFTIK